MLRRQKSACATPSLACPLRQSGVPEKQTIRISDGRGGKREATCHDSGIAVLPWNGTQNECTRERPASRVPDFILFCVGATEAECAGKTGEVEKSGNKMMHERICSTPRLLPLAPVKLKPPKSRATQGKQVGKRNEVHFFPPSHDSSTRSRFRY